MTLQIPPSSDGQAPDFPAVFESIVAFDQFDDWLPDSIYFEDQRLNRNEVLERVAKLWQSKTVNEKDRETVSVPREDGKTLPALALGLDLRIVSQAVIAGLAPAIRNGLLRDKVGGFDFDGKTRPLFAPPGAGMSGLTGRVAEAALLQGDENIYVLDVNDFSNAAMFDRLANELTRARAREDQVKFLRAVTESSSRSLPSIDDSFAFLYNYYLAPVDRAIVAKRVNFFRYRDEYFLIQSADVALVENALRDYGLNSRMLRPGLGVTARGEDGSRLGERWFDQEVVDEPGNRLHDSVSEVVARVGDGVLVGTYECQALGERNGKKPMCMTDHFELKYEDDPDLIRARFFGICSAAQPLDGVEAVPVLRAFNNERRAGVLNRPPLDNAPESARRHRDRLLPFRVCLNRALGIAIERKSAWQVSWTAPLLADLGPLRPAEVELMRRGLDASLGPVADVPLRLALARASSEPVESVWRAVDASEGSYRRRGMAVLASFLARRGAPAPWNAIRASLTADQPILARFLNGYI